ncbi:acyl-CoA thioesterase [Citreimonas salinaria]|uniref:4-hydroxybenzoyl-CoA thioesterase n=1 Tax=Citreimonas salinaria TaxID=321339 RepID=A0A1H3K378_9RHOB|nr:thioesterase family protein [Citreimonas salinaria]SDY46611.1 4-hydroxybenzoyl-CoA thioesterase [Citreimonas salinaria]
MATFTHRTPVMFQHCDPAGIVFYPRYFEMINAVVETFFDRALDWSFATLHGSERMGVPMGRIDANFHAASRLGDVLDWSLTIGRIGRGSAEIEITGACGAEARLSVRGTLVLVDLDKMKSRPWPEARRAALERYTKENTA